jgi:hypothetical protein
MQQQDNDANVDRSRLTLLLGLSSTAAAAGCGGTPTARKKGDAGYATFDRRQTGGEGGEGGGGGGGGD